MTITTISSREFNQNISKAKKDAKNNPVIITDRGKPAHVLLTIEQYLKITESEKNLLDLLALPSAAAVGFDPPKIDKLSFRPADLT